MTRQAGWILITAAFVLWSGRARAAETPERPQYPAARFAPGRTTATVTVGEVTARIGLEQRPDIDKTLDVPVLHVSVQGREVLQVPGVPSGMTTPAAEASIAEIDPGNGRPEVYFTSYSGGAHCCTHVVVAEETPTGWVAVPLGDFDGDGDFLNDLDKDGVAEIAAVDNRFLYQFDCYACSAAPLMVLTVRNGAAADLSTEARFLPAHRDWLKELEDNVEPADRWKSAGFLAGWVAERVRLGEGAAAFKEVNQHWNASRDRGTEVCVTGGNLDDCKKGDRRVLKFPERLKLFLQQNSYGF